MAIQIWAFAATLTIVGCSSPTPGAKGRVVIAVTIDWEGAYLPQDGLAALEQLREHLGQAPMTHFVSAAYFTKQPPYVAAAAMIAKAVRKGDELALHLHAWRSLALAGGIEPRLAPSYLTGTDKLLEFEDGDVGFDTDLDAYSVPELRVLLRTSRLLLEPTHRRVSTSFRAGGYLGTPKVLQAIREEGFSVDSSATDSRQLLERRSREDQDDRGEREALEPAADALSKRVKALWPGVDSTTQPWLLRAPGGDLLEMPVAALADHATAAEIVAMVEAAHTRLQSDPARDVFVVLALELEIAGEYASRISEAIATLRARRALADRMVFATVASAAERARAQLAAAPK